MRKYTALFLLLATVGLGAQQPTTTTLTNAIRRSFDSEKVTVSSTAIGFTASKINPTCTNCNPISSRASAATCSVETDAIRILTTGTNPTATTGLYIASGSAFTIYGYNDIAAFKGIRVTNDATLNCIYYR